MRPHAPAPHNALAQPCSEDSTKWTGAGAGPRFCLYVHHTDAEREWAYDRQPGLARFDKGWDEAVAKGWTVVDMKNDWKTVFPAAPR